MLTRILLISAVLIGGGWLVSPPVEAGCLVDSGTYTTGTVLREPLCDTSGNLKTTIGGAGNGTVAIDQTTPGTTNGVSLTTLLSGEDQTNNLEMTSGGAVRTFNLMTGVTTNTTSDTQIIHSGGKTILASVVGTGAQTATVDIFGDSDNTTGNGIWLCTIVLSGTTRATGSCNHQITKDYPYYHAVTSGVTGTGATVQVDAIVGAIGSQQSEFKWSGEKTADALIKTGPGFLRCIIISTSASAPTAGTISINDATSAGTGTVIKSWVLTTAVFTPVQFCPETPFTTGLYFDFTTAAGINVAGSFR